MKFVPRQPQPPPERSGSSTTTTRFLRLQPADDVPAPAQPTVKFVPRPLPPFVEQAANPEDATASQRVRLRLDPQVASQPLPAVARVMEWSAPVSAESSAAPETAEAPEVYAEPESAVMTAEPEAMTHDEVVAPEASEEPFVAESSEASEPIAAAPETGVFFEIPPVAETVERVWVAPGPVPASSPEPIYSQPTEPVATQEIPKPLSVKSQPVPTRPKSTIIENRPPRPELRRPSPSLTHLARPEQPLGRGFWFLLVLLVLALAGVLYFFWLAPRLAAIEAQKRALAAAGPHPVEFVMAHRSIPVVELPVKGTVEASRETAIYARTTGYVKTWLVDLGDKVQAGQVLAQLDTPDVDHELTQARASADQAKAATELAQNEADRWSAMVHDHAVSQADADAKIAALNEAKANANAAEAAVGRLVDIETFKEIRAPYAGTITARNLEVGTLVGVGPGPAGSELFRLIQTDPVRIFVDVPEANAPSIRSSLPAKLEIAAYPSRVFTGQVVRDAGALDPKTHMLRTEVHVANPDGTLLPGTLADVHLLLFDTTPSLLVPASALITNGGSTSVARLMPSDGREVVRLTPVTIGRAFGSDVEILTNLKDGDRVVANPPADLKDGMVVSARPFEEPAPTLLPPKPSAPRA